MDHRAHKRFRVFIGTISSSSQNPGDIMPSHHVDHQAFAKPRFAQSGTNDVAGSLVWWQARCFAIGDDLPW
jgi:hypothetical protein